MSKEDTNRRDAAERMAAKLYTGAKQSGGTLTFEQAQKISANAIKRNERNDQ